MRHRCVWLLLSICYYVASHKCTDLFQGFYHCEPAEINPATQQPTTCTKDNIAEVTCRLRGGIDTCEGLTANGTFSKKIPCQYTSGKSYKTALLLSIFLGWLGADRFYLGYYAIGCFKLFTVGFMLIFHLVDIILIALQVVGPADGSAYLIDYYGPRSIRVCYNQDTFIAEPQVLSQYH